MATCPVCNAQLAETDTACPVCGFKLIGQTQAFKPITMNPTPNMASPQLLSEATLSIVKGPQVGNVFLNDMTVSRMHATMRRTPAGYEIVDADSFNGLWVNNLNVKDAVLKDGDVIQIGTFCLVYQATPQM